MTIVELSYPGISTILNEYPLYDIVHVHELFLNEGEEKLKLKNGKIWESSKQKKKIKEG